MGWMAYTVRQVAGLSGVSIRTLHFYDEVGLLKPAFVSAGGYRYYEEPQLLTLQQILFYRELGLELKEIQTILGRADFEKAAKPPIDLTEAFNREVENRRGREDRERDLDDGLDRSFDPTDPKR